MKAISQTILFTVFIFGILSNTYSQDIITLRTGDEIKAIVSEIDKDIIKYKKFENPTGPLYTLEKSSVFMIKYENGTKEVFEISSVENTRAENGNASAPDKKGSLTYQKYGSILENGELLSIIESRTILSNNPEALKNYNNGLKLIKAGKVLSGIGLATSLGIGLLIKEPSMTVLAVGVLVASTGLIGSITTTVSGRKKIKKSVGIYNSGLVNP